MHNVKKHCDVFIDVENQMLKSFIYVYLVPGVEATPPLSTWTMLSFSLLSHREKVYILFF